MADNSALFSKNNLLPDMSEPCWDILEGQSPQEEEKLEDGDWNAGIYWPDTTEYQDPSIYTRHDYLHSEGQFMRLDPRLVPIQHTDTMTSFILPALCSPVALMSMSQTFWGPRWRLLLIK